MIVPGQLASLRALWRVLTPRRRRQFALLQDFTFQQAMYKLMTKQYEMARVDEAREAAVLLSGTNRLNHSPLTPPFTRREGINGEDSGRR
ncbi:predicted oxidoreductase related to aryl-alcohol dehydrogenase [Serpentinimonas raichei]|uniref:Predicted oxidoreductase related to aryl-alcohol dehydrogenase n=1 Tax=Serpentinimonas raichei TaxID=1458425 RepID=A0A060NMB4_9BURK|nr:hypothetical protein [Serpentinimonas raichei]MBT9161468.1 hypothetical protein [Chloroflexota bacterium]BAO80064.1 predicted oxidoreductase related to aryl-alcohol dehydrogenase [Serpentinimonas raichei]